MTMATGENYFWIWPSLASTVFALRLPFIYLIISNLVLPSSHEAITMNKIIIFFLYAEIIYIREN